MIARQSVMLVLMVAAVASGQVAELKDLRPMPKQAGWCEQDNRVFEAADLTRIREVARICGSVSLRVDGDRLKAGHVKTAVKLASEARVPLSLAWSPWGFGLPEKRDAKGAVLETTRADGTVVDGSGKAIASYEPKRVMDKARALNLRWAKLSQQWIDDANRELGTNVRVAFLMLDFERWRFSADTYLRLRETQALMQNVYGASVEHEWYACGQLKLSGRGWITDSYGAEYLTGITSYSCVLYQVARPEYDQARFSQTAVMAKAMGLKVTPWISLDAGWAPQLGWWPEGSPSWFGVSECWAFGDSYPVPDWCAWLAGLWTCSGSAGPPELPDNKIVKRIVFYPGALDPRCPNWERQFRLFAAGSRALATTTKPGS